MFRIVITELSTPAASEVNGPILTVERYAQTVDELDLSAIIAAANRKPRKPRAPRVASVKAAA